MSGLRKLALTPCCVAPSTALRVTSLPVPAVVGAAMNGKRRGRKDATLSHHLEKLERLAAVGGNGGNRFAGINCAAPAERDDDIAGGVVHAPRALADQVDRRLAGYGKGFG